MAVVLIVIAVPSISGVCYYRKKAHERSEREENQTMMMVIVGEGAQELVEVEHAPRKFAGTGGWWFPLPHRDLKYSWTPLCRTRLSRTPRDIELFLAPLNSNQPRLGLCISFRRNTGQHQSGVQSRHLLTRCTENWEMCYGARQIVGELAGQRWYSESFGLLISSGHYSLVRFSGGSALCCLLCSLALLFSSNSLTTLRAFVCYGEVSRTYGKTALPWA